MGRSENLQRTADSREKTGIFHNLNIKTMYKYGISKKITMHFKGQQINESYEGETIEDKIKRITLNKEPITDGAPQIFTERKDGVLAETDIRTDRFEIAVEATTALAKAIIAKREGTPKTVAEQAKEGMDKEKTTEITKGEPIQGTSSTGTGTK